MGQILSYTDWALNEMHMATNAWSDEDHAEWETLHLQNLEKLSEIMKKHRANWWVDCGTLLGLHRDKGMIKGDSDTDIGLDVTSISLELIDALQPHFPKTDGTCYDYEEIKSCIDTDKFSTIKNLKFCGLKGKNGSVKKFKGLPIMCDVFIYFPHKKDMIYRYGSDYCRGKADHLSGCKSFQHKGISLKKPGNVDGHLVSLYGKAWKEPDSKFSPKQTTVYSGPITQEDFGGKYTYNFKTKQSRLQ